MVYQTRRTASKWYVSESPIASKPVGLPIRWLCAHPCPARDSETSRVAISAISGHWQLTAVRRGIVYGGGGGGVLIFTKLYIYIYKV